MTIPPEHVLIKKGEGIVCKYCSYVKKSTGCDECDKLPDKELCLDCQLEQANADALKAMSRVQELEKRKIITIAHEIKQKVKERADVRRKSI